MRYRYMLRRVKRSWTVIDALLPLQSSHPRLAAVEYDQAAERRPE
jgi:hypothetical protein